MKILIAPDKFKGSLTAQAVCEAVAEGIHRCDPGIQTVHFPLADGGDGTAEILTYHAKGRMEAHTVQDPLFRPVRARFGLSGDGQTGFIEMAEASGLHLLSVGERNPLRTSSVGTGQLIAWVVEMGVRKIILGIGGSATNDGGMGMAAALGYRFLDEVGKELRPVGENLMRIAQIEHRNVPAAYKTLEVKVACDVDNPLTGPTGASSVYGPQKGATPADVQALNDGLKHFAHILRKQIGKDVEWVPGAGAAGGMGAGALVFLGAQLVSGTDLVLEQTDFAAQLEGVDLVITGEGKLDQQTLRGKLIHGIVAKAKKRQIPVAAICGTLEADPADLQALGLCFAASIINRPCTLEEAMRESYVGVRSMAYHLVQLFRTGRT